MGLSGFHDWIVISNMWVIVQKERCLKQALCLWPPSPQAQKLPVLHVVSCSLHSVVYWEGGMEAAAQVPTCANIASKAHL